MTAKKGKAITAINNLSVEYRQGKITLREYLNAKSVLGKVK